MGQPTGSSHMSYTLGALSVGGGIAGYAKTGSLPSLIAGIGIGTLYLGGGYLINKKSPDVGHRLNLFAAFLLSASMVPRYISTRKVWPSGIMGLAGVVSLVYEGRRALDWQS